LPCCKHLTEKDAALAVIDTHAGAGLYRLDGDYAENQRRVGLTALPACRASAELAPVLQDYVDADRWVQRQGGR
jgi:23S rRNA (adenine2030-N6)-methyltransferase